MLLSEYTGSFPVLTKGLFSGWLYLMDSNYTAIDCSQDSFAQYGIGCIFAHPIDTAFHEVIDWFEDDYSIPTVGGIVKTLDCRCPSLLKGHEEICPYRK
jgi:hypothetical protein